jgi:predicted TIM-barrel fold metal-dependent hydrolase
VTGMSIDDLASSTAFGGGKGRREQVTFLPEPEPRAARYTVISVDDHVVEPPDAFTRRFPDKFRDDAPRVVPTDDGGEAWIWQGQVLPNVGFNAVAGRPNSEFGFEPTRFDEMRRGAWNVDARVADMDIDGVYASLCFPSFLPGFVGQRLTLCPDDDALALAAMRAYNDWHLEAWAGAHPSRFVPNQITYLRDPEIAAQEIHRNAARGFKAATFSEAPDKLGLASIHSGYWDPLFRACAETETVLCLHVGSSGTSPTTSDDAPPEIPAVLFGAYGMYSAIDWLYSKIPVRFPDIKICLSEGGIGWVAGIIDRLDHCYKYQLGYLPTWRGVALSPSEVLRRNFWFCALDDDSGMRVRDRIGVDHILVESDYPHADSSWPDTQAMLVRQLEGQGVDEHDTRRITWQNASELFRHPVPPDLQR